MPSIHRRYRQRQRRRWSRVFRFSMEQLQVRLRAQVCVFGTRTFGRLLQQSPVIQDYLNAAIERVVVAYIAPWRIQIGNYIADVIASWDGPKIAETIELHVGADLQYIRINGTLVGALIGAALFLIGAALGTL